MLGRDLPDLPPRVVLDLLTAPPMTLVTPQMAKALDRSRLDKPLLQQFDRMYSDPGRSRFFMIVMATTTRPLDRYSYTYEAEGRTATGEYLYSLLFDAESLVHASRNHDLFVSLQDYHAFNVQRRSEAIKNIDASKFCADLSATFSKRKPSDLSDLGTIFIVTSEPITVKNEKMFHTASVLQQDGAELQNPPIAVHQASKNEKDQYVYRIDSLTPSQAAYLSHDTRVIEIISSETHRARNKFLQSPALSYKPSIDLVATFTKAQNPEGWLAKKIKSWQGQLYTEEQAAQHIEQAAKIGLLNSVNTFFWNLPPNSPSPLAQNYKGYFAREIERGLPAMRYANVRYEDGPKALAQYVSEKKFREEFGKAVFSDVLAYLSKNDVRFETAAKNKSLKIESDGENATLTMVLPKPSI